MGGKAVSVRSKDDLELRAHRLCIDLVAGRTSREYVRAGFFDDRHCVTICEGKRYKRGHFSQVACSSFYSSHLSLSIRGMAFYPCNREHLT